MMESRLVLALPFCGVIVMVTRHVPLVRVVSRMDDVARQVFGV